MFTGIVEAVGIVRSVATEGSNRRLAIEVEDGFLEGVRPGDSIAVDGACLTPVVVRERSFEVEAVGTTLSRTVAGAYRPGHRVNLERAMELGARLDGHLVQGHVDGVGELRGASEEGGYLLLVFRVPAPVHRLTLEHGSITLNGVSLTVNRLLPDQEVEVAVIPHTREHTNLGELRPGDPVNVEGDLIGKYVGKLLLTERGEGAPVPPRSAPEGDGSREGAGDGA